jgi:hypothetical protein
MAGLKQPLQDILTKLSLIQVTNQDGQTVGIYSRVWNNQVEREKDGETYIYPKPAAFVEIVGPLPFEETGKNLRSARLVWAIHLVHEYYNQDGTFEQDLVIYDLRDQVIAALSQYTPTACTMLVAEQEQADYDHDNVYHYIINFSCTFMDSKASPYDDGRGIYIDKQPPTGVNIVGDYGDSPRFLMIDQPYKIPQ